MKQLASVLLAALVCQSLFGLPQDIAGGAAALIGQDIIGGASVIFKRPPRVRDLAGGAAALIAKQRPPRRVTSPTEIARNRPTASPQPGVPQPEATPEISTQAKVEALNDQGNERYADFLVEAMLYSPDFAPLKGDPRFEAIVRRLHPHA